MIRPEVQSEIDATREAFARLRSTVTEFVSGPRGAVISEQHIADLIKTLARLRGWKVSTAARKVAGSGDAVERFEAGISVTVRRAGKIIENCWANWPAGNIGEWPNDVPKPAQAGSEDAA